MRSKEELRCFIDSDGNLIKIDNNLSIEEFSKKYSEGLNIDLKKIYSKIQIIRPEYKNVSLTYKELLIDILGYVLYNFNSHNVSIIPPEFNINERDITCKQVNAVSKLLKFNNQPECLICKLFFTSGKYENITIEEIIKENMEENKIKILTNCN